MAAKNISIDMLMGEMKFNPTPNQRDAILHLDGRLHLSAGRALIKYYGRA